MNSILAKETEQTNSPLIIDLMLEALEAIQGELLGSSLVDIWGDVVFAGTAMFCLKEILPKGITEDEDFLMHFDTIVNHSSHLYQETKQSEQLTLAVNYIVDEVAQLIKKLQKENKFVENLFNITLNEFEDEFLDYLEKRELNAG